MFTPYFILTALLPLSNALAITTDSLGTCLDSNKIPTADQYVAGYQSFCDTYMPESGYYHIIANEPIISTTYLTQANGKTVQWVYLIETTWDRGPENAVPGLVLDHYVDKNICMERFGAMLDNQGKGTALCMIGDTVCMTGGDTIWDITPKGSAQRIKLHFKSYKRRGT